MSVLQVLIFCLNNLCMGTKIIHELSGFCLIICRSCVAASLWEPLFNVLFSGIDVCVFISLVSFLYCDLGLVLGMFSFILIQEGSRSKSFR
ncbi:hypothetical protein I3760_07G140900 [Carya illinoinensis]|uniref:Uncharacterized protein n=1 Tax=Carya illinoinensis TaxID=32201 RepID=A0A922EJ71_CARIL|nr:hypothetical protein I3760_07G140900 [Carya illinoinensis]KAG6704698.1 hypothetical protein I3842_07G145300 [Carya illinoinensis]